MFNTSIAIWQLIDRIATSLEARIRRNEKGQATAEYALVLLLAAVVAFVVTKYIGKEGGSNPITSLVGTVIDKVLSVGSKFVPFLK